MPVMWALHVRAVLGLARGMASSVPRQQAAEWCIC